MKIAFLHQKSPFGEELLKSLRIKLPKQELLSWIAGEDPVAQDIEFLLAMGPVVRQQMVDLTKLGFIQTTSAGFEDVDLDAASELGIWVSSSPSGATGNAASVAEFAILLLLAASRRLGAVLKSESGHEFHTTQVHPSLSGKTVCIVGLGSIGEQIVERLRPFAVTMVGTDEHPENAPPDVKAYSPDRLHEAVADSDFVVLCVPGSKANENLINAHVLHAMKRGAILVNIARGTLVDEQALMAAVKEGQISAGGLDVVRNEPLASSDPLLRFPQLVVTPHIAGFTDLMLRGTIDYISQVIELVAASQKPKSVLNLPAPPRWMLRG